MATKKDLKGAGFKVTHPRMKILAILEQAKQHHMSAEDVYKVLLAQKEEVGLATVYRVLMQFHEAGMVKRHNFSEGHSVFELDMGSHHDHLVCVKCGLVEEFVDAVIEARQQEIAKKKKFQMTDHVLNIYGICKGCRE